MLAPARILPSILVAGAVLLVAVPAQESLPAEPTGGAGPAAVRPAVEGPSAVGAPPAELPASFFAGRRAALREALGEGLVILRGAEQAPDNGVFTQDQEFWYLSGVADPGVALVLDVAAGRDLLYVPPFNRFTATWDGARLVPGEEAAERTGFDEVRNVRAFVGRELDELLGGDQPPVVWTLIRARPNRTATQSTAGGAARRIAEDPLDGRVTRGEALRAALQERFPKLEVRELGPVLDRLRGVKTTEEVACIRAASESAAHAIAEAMKSAAPGVYEYQLAAAARYVMSLQGNGADAYAAIVGGGPNGCVLHYSANSRRLLEDDLIVMDYGATVHGYATDVTRTFPASGRFTPEQRKLVEDVRAVQQQLIAMVKPGASLGELSRACRQLLSERGYRSDHGPCHHVGLAVHDKGDGRLAPGMVITVEPGAYLRDQGMGCRIEDTVLVTEDGCEVLSAAVPSDPDAIEALMQQDGIVQASVGLPAGR